MEVEESMMALSSSSPVIDDDDDNAAKSTTAGDDFHLVEGQNDDAEMKPAASTTDVEAKDGTEAIIDDFMINEDDKSSTTGDEDDDEDPLEDEDDDDFMDDDDDNDNKKKQDPEILLLKASQLKEEGNNYFSTEQDYEKASRSYRKGFNTIKHLNKANSGDEQVRTLLLSLQTNLSMMQYKLCKYKQSQDIATKALEIDPYHVKALFRRAVARRKLGDAEEAMTDLKSALSKEPNNTSVRKELLAIKKEIEVAKKVQKDALQKAFSKGSGLYKDKEEEEKKQLEKEKEKKKQEQELYKQRKQLWEDECVSRMAKGQDAISFDDWDKQRKEKEEKERKEQEQKRNEEELRRKEEQRKAREAAKASRGSSDMEEEDDSEEFTEKELAEMRGYKKTADGRITSYFTREQSVKIDTAPKPIVPGNAPLPQPITLSTSGEPSMTAAGGKGQASVWNNAGTWEEKDTTEWCRQHLEKRLKETKAEASSGGNIVCVVTAVKDMTGDASVAIVSGKKRYIFDLHCKVKFEMKEITTEADGEDNVIASGTLKLPDICSTHHEELEVEFNGWKKQPTKDKEQIVNDCRLRIISEIRESVKLWVADFNNHY